jgi:hypothetical protein
VVVRLGKRSGENTKRRNESNKNEEQKTVLRDWDHPRLTPVTNATDYFTLISDCTATDGLIDD